ncbi:helix-turn-helix domain-containing protein [Proteinivorax hydrogeniformans]|uniref:Helix-turn-helix domain-containing protein n=1 Tax=Proteinivorax hydrogeniformans TaxID=1826727 RepID=A0AAU8HSD9_9FIRM
MKTKTKYSAKEKYQIIQEYKNGNSNKSSIAYKYNINRGTISDWLTKYSSHGIEGLRNSKKINKYPKKVKEQAIKDYLTNDYTLRSLAKKYGISDHSVLRKWIKKYNGHRKSNSVTEMEGMDYSMSKRKSVADKVKVVEFCIKNDCNYKLAAKTYEVSYQQVYQWVKKYKSGKQDALKDGRGRKKSEEELTPTEKAKLEIQRIERENEKLRAENAYLKKLKALERWDL